VAQHSPLTNRSLLVTGGTGSFGSCFVRHALDVGARRVVVFSRDELKQSQMAAELSDERVRYMIGSVEDRDRVAMAAAGCELLVHAAAMKQIPTCETHPRECKRTNVDGTEAVAMACIDAGVSRAVFLSTDKAAHPNTHYGACKLVAERLWTQANVYAAGTATRLVATRYGNVLSSRGSVVPVWREQAALKGRIAITDPHMTRFWMKLEDAVHLVETALRDGRGGEVFVPKIGASNIMALASAVVPGVPWDKIGVRAGEKLHETLISDDEARTTWEYADHYRIEPHRTWEYLPPGGGSLVLNGWTYRSDTAPTLSVDQLREMVGA
jgi:UDP-N-acetylglucosamine 4,6-dehydratase/5-epimerase